MSKYSNIGWELNTRMIERINTLTDWKLVTWMIWSCLKKFDVALSICISFERMKIRIFGALSLALIGVGEPLLKLGTSLESFEAFLWTSCLKHFCELAVNAVNNVGDRLGLKRDQLGKAAF